jgi:hypothetical protein
MGLGRIVMLLLPGLKSVYERCLFDDPQLRPQAQQVFRILEKIRNRRRLWLRGLASVVLVLILSIGSSLIFNQNGDGILNRIDRYKRQKNIEDLRELWRNPSHTIYRETIVSTIADVNLELEQRAVRVDSLKDYIAIFAIEMDPSIILQEGTLRLGDWATIENRYGYVSEINQGSIILSTNNGSKEATYPLPGMLGRPIFDFSPISIQPNSPEGRRFNLLYLLETICAIKGLRYTNTAQVDGFISGQFHETSYVQFLNNPLLAEHIDFDGAEVIVKEAKKPRVLIGLEPAFGWTDLSFSSFLKKYERHVGYHLELVSPDTNDYYYYPLQQFHEMLNNMGATIENMTEDTIYIKLNLD